MKARIVLPAVPGHGAGVIELDGHDVANAVRGVSIDSAVNQITRVTLDLHALETTTFEGEVQVVIPSDTYDALVALGWTPPSSANSERIINP